MAKVVGQLKAILGLDKKKYDRGLKDAKKQGSKFGSAMKKVGGILAGAFAVTKIVQWAKALKQAYQMQMEAEIKLATIMKQRMGLGKAAVKDLKRQASAYQKVGIIGDEIQLSGLQQLATFLKQKESLESLLPAMNNLVAQQRGFNATSQDAVNIANLMGKVLDGQVSSLKRVGISFTEAQNAALKTGNEMERAAILAEVINNNVGNVNEELGKTDLGLIQAWNNAWGDLKETLGSHIVPLLGKAAKLITGLITPKESKALQLEKKRLNDLIGVITHEITLKEDRLELIKKLQREYPDFLENLNAETITNEELRTQLVKVNEAYDDKIKAAVRQELIAKYSKRLARLTEAEYEAIERLQWLQSDSPSARNLGARREDEIRATEAIIKKRQEQRRAIEDLIEAMLELYNLGKGAPSPPPKGKTPPAGTTTGEPTETTTEVALFGGQKFPAAMPAAQMQTPGLTAPDISGMLKTMEEGQVAALQFDNLMGYISQKIYDYSAGVMEFTKSLAGYINMTMEQELAMVEKIAKKRNKSDQWLEKQRERIQKKYGAKLKAAAVTEAIINTAIGITKALAQEGVLGIITGALVAAAGAVQLATIQGQSFAEGGIVPPGYPRDTYPAMLSSGEMVIPPQQMRNFGGSMDITLRTDITRGEDLYWIIEEVKRKRRDNF